MTATRADNFMAQVACHREVQVALHKLFSFRFNRSTIDEYALNYTVIHNVWAFMHVCINMLIKIKQKN